MSTSSETTDPLINHFSENPKNSTLDQKIEHCLGNFTRKQFIQAFLISLSWFFDAQQTFITIFTDSGSNPTWNFSGGLPASSFFSGCLAGGFLLATLADSSLGRKNLLVISSLIMSLSGLLTSAAPGAWTYSALRFVSGFGRSSVGTTGMVLVTELVAERWRGRVGIAGFFCFTFGFLSLPMIGYLNEGSSWRLMYLWTCFPAVVYSVVLYWFAFESPRWLYLQGRKKEFLETLTKLGNAILITDQDQAEENSRKEEDEEEKQGKDSNSGSYFAAIRPLWEEPWAFRRLTAVMVIGFGAGTVYYGMPLGLNSLPFNLYASVALNAISEFPAALIPFFLVRNLNRKSLILGFSMLSGICSILCACLMFGFPEPWNIQNQGLESVSPGIRVLKIALEMVSFFSACTMFNVLLIYTLELFPTCVRNSALSMARQAMVLGGVVGPVVVAAGKNGKGFYSYGIFGLTIAITGLFVVSLPETMGGSICDTLEEEKEKEFRQRN